MEAPLRRILEQKGGAVVGVDAQTTVREAVRRMNAERIGAVVVLDEGSVVGIFTERDVLARVVDAGRDPETTPVAEVMTASVATVSPDLTVGEAMLLVTERRFRHLPVLEEGRLVGMVSAGDLMRWLVRDQAAEIQQLVAYISGEYT
ncbi:CBS domain-containing protein [Inmirania thermothiophila]|uniref:CBS domain protein n=1 Tax=Inmirania thermothiophila TaxID=1750597 RepID=A0A3N1Y894_9GAMM|nr:CBS domain-containing protein [Inmirania thermothiophila]ROR34980.1 CBS domain protein [Inmirania thermothiophila]